MTVLGAILSIGLSGSTALAQPSLDSPGDLASLERAWHDCVRDAFRRQPTAQSRAASQRSALDERHALTRPEAIQVLASGRLTEAISYRFADGRTFADTRRLA